MPSPVTKTVDARNMKMFKMNFVIANLPADEAVVAEDRPAGVATARPHKIPVQVAILRVVALVDRESGKLLAMQ